MKLFSEKKSNLAAIGVVEKTMTVKEIAEVLKLDVRTIQIKAKELFPEKIKERETTYFNEVEVTAIKNACEKKFAVETKEDKKAILRRAFEILQDENEELRTKIALDAPKVEAYEELMSADSSISLKETAAVLNIEGMGQNNLFRFLKNNKILQNDNVPYRQYIERGYFRQIAQTWKNEAKSFERNKTVVTPKGLDYIRKIIKERYL